jgi:hypothetical protein
MNRRSDELLRDARSAIVGEQLAECRRDGGRETSPRQAVSEPKPASRQAAFHGRDWPIKLASRLVVRQTLEIAQVDGATILRGKSVDLFSERVAKVLAFERVRRVIRGGGLGPMCAELLGPGAGSSSNSNVSGNPVEPATERSIDPD